MSDAAPIFTVRDLHATVHFYQNVLGATGTGVFPSGTLDYPTHAEVDLYGQKLMFTPDKGPPGSEGAPWRARALTSPGFRGAGMAIQVSLDEATDLDKLHEHVLENGGSVVMAPQTAPWGPRVFAVEDPDGYVVCFSRRQVRN